MTATPQGTHSNDNDSFQAKFEDWRRVQEVFFEYYLSTKNADDANVKKVRTALDTYYDKYGTAQSSNAA
jgi:hypothetical protein